MKSKNQAGGHNTPQGGNKSGSSAEDSSMSKQSGSQGSGSQQVSKPGVERSDSLQSCDQGAGKNPSNVGGR